MKNSFKLYISIVLIHMAIAIAIFTIPFLSKLYALIIPVLGFIYIVKTKNRNNEVLLVAAYMVGMEVFLRMTQGNFNNEFIKVNVVFFMLLGMLYRNFSVSAFIYWIFLILLIPGILVTTSTADFNTDVRKILVFNLSGEVCLAVAAIYMCKRKILFDDLQNVILALGLPVVTTVVYLFLYNPSVKDVIKGTQSNFDTSGGFGPNQVSTILGLGMFVFFTQLILFSKSKKMMLLNGFLLLFISYRAVVTFSRGGVITAIIMIICLLFFLYNFSNAKGKSKFFLVFVLTGLMGASIWGYSSLQTAGLINKRYANEDALGRTKKDRLGGREEIMEAEFKIFMDNPVTGVGAGMGKSVRKESFGMEIASHNEMTRMLSEHGLMGIVGMLILLVTPFVLYLNNRHHLYILSFYIFWLLTINHAAMRLAAPAFVYALSLLSVQIKIPEKAEISGD